MSSRKTEDFGYSGGKEFRSEPVHSIGFRAQNILDAILLNGNRHGGTGGKDCGTLDFSADE